MHSERNVTNTSPQNHVMHGHQGCGVAMSGQARLRTSFGSDNGKAREGQIERRRAARATGLTRRRKHLSHHIHRSSSFKQASAHRQEGKGSMEQT